MSLYLLIVSDIHGEEEALFRIRKRMMSGAFDFLLVCGDISRSVTFVEELVAGLVGKVFLVPGNWDPEPVNKFILGSDSCIHGKKVALSDKIALVGFGFSNITPFGTFGELSEDEIYRRMSKLQIDEKTILLMHCPPRGFFDEVKGKHIGSESIRKIIEEKKPLIAFFGHAHDYEGKEKYKDTMLIKVPPANKMRGCAVRIEGEKINIEFVVL
jgi:hypothetical protein